MSLWRITSRWSGLTDIPCLVIVSHLDPRFLNETACYDVENGKP